MSNNRKTASDNQDIVLFEEVDGMCPLCSASLIYEKNGRKYRQFEKAHIYPLNPTSEEHELLKNEKKLSSDVNSLNNLIALCKSCHTQFDKPRTVEEYRKVYAIKKKLLKAAESKSVWKSFNLEEDINKIIEELAFEDNFKTYKKLEYDPKTIDSKINNTLSPLTKRKIKGQVSEYYHIVKSKLIAVDAIKQSSSELISSQIKSYYIKMSLIHDDQQSIYEEIVNWLNHKTNSISYDASSIIVSFFIQNCEVFK